MNKLTGIFLCVAALIAVSIAPAHAEEITIPWGAWLGASLVYLRDGIITLVVLLIGVIANRLSPSMRDVLMAAQVEQLLSRAVDYGISAVAGATRDGKMSVQISNEVLAAAVKYAVVNAPDLAAKIGENLRPKIIARMTPYLPVDASAKNLNAELKPPVV